MSIKALQDYTYISRYARFNNKEKRRETWNEAVDRVMQMHIRKFPHMTSDIEWAFDKVRQKLVLGSQRALQFGGRPIEQKNARLYNCCVSFCDRARFFQESLWLLLCGCGVGFSVQHHHIAKLPDFHKSRINADKHKKRKYVIPDSIEGWSDALGILMATYMPHKEFSKWYGCDVEFDFSEIRPAGAILASGVGKAPGPEPLRRSLEIIRNLLDDRCQLFYRLRSIDAYDIIMHASDAVLSGGVRRSATICLFSIDDMEMRKAKTGNWFTENPQRARSNNSMLLIRGETTKEQFEEAMKDVKEFGEPGFVFADHPDLCVNPCCEIGMWPVHEKTGESGWQVCNLCEINGRKIKSKEDFAIAARAAAIIGTLQAAYTKFEYLGKVTEEIVEREALLGVSITGMMDNPDIIFDENNQQEMAKLVLDTNEWMAKKIGINPAARVTCVKPAGCLDKDTVIRTLDGNFSLLQIFEQQGHAYEDIKDLSDTWLKLSKPLVIFNELNEPESVKELYVNGRIKTIEIPLEDGSYIKATPWHKFKLVDGSWKRADEIQEGDDISVKVIGAPFVSSGEVFTLDIETEKTHTYQLANGVISHNTTSCILGSASGIHPHHAKRYFRRIQGNQMEAPLQYFKEHNEFAVEKSVWSANKTDEVITFCVEIPDGAKTKNQLSALKLLEHVKNTQANWVMAGTRPELCTQPWLRHNVSNTINVRPDEWEGVTDYIYDNREFFTGIALLPQSGDLDYPQAPMCTVYTPREIVQTYGDGSLFASGLIVHGLKAFEDNLWAACETVLGHGEPLIEPVSPDVIVGIEPDIVTYEVMQAYQAYKTAHAVWEAKNDFVRRAIQFSNRYFDGDLKKTTYCLKCVHNWKLWCDLNREYKNVDYSLMMEETDETKVMNTIACSGGSCEIV